MQAVVDDLLTNYIQSGKGEVVLLIHGWGSNISDLTHLINGLSTNYQVIALDLPGFGKSQKPKETWDLNSYAKFVASFVSKTKLKPYAIVGHSNGGAIAIKAVAKGYLSPDKLILISTAGIRNKSKGKRQTIKLITKAGKIVSSPLPAKTKSKLRSKLYSSIGSDYLVNEDLGETFKNVVSEDLQALAKQLNVPTLLIYGEEDKSTPVIYGQLYHELIDASTLEIVSLAGHFVFQDKPELVVKLIKDFL